MISYNTRNNVISPAAGSAAFLRCWMIWRAAIRCCGKSPARAWWRLENRPCLCSFNCCQIAGRTSAGKRPRPWAASPIRLPLGLGQRPGRPRRRCSLGRRRRPDCVESRGTATLVGGVDRTGQSLWFRQGAHHVCHTLARRRRLGPLLRPLLAAFDQFQPQMAVPLAAYAALTKLRELLEK